MSIGWSITGLLLGVFSIFLSLAEGDLSPIGLMLELFFLLKLLNAARAARAWHSMDDSSLPTSGPIEPR